MIEQNILFIRLRLLGDIIFTIPAIQRYSNNFPRNKIYYVVEEKFLEIARLIPGVCQVITVPKKMGIKELMKFRREIKKLKISLTIDFHSGPKSALLTLLTGSAKRIGYKTPNRDWAYNHLVPRHSPEFLPHSVWNQLRLLGPAGIKLSTPPAYPEIDLKHVVFSKKLKNAVLKKGIVIHIGAGNRFRDWGIENFSSLITRLLADGHTIHLIGNTEPEIMRAGILKKKFSQSSLNNCVGKLSISETLYLIANAQVYFGVDSGPLHLASLTRTPIVAIYGPNIPEVSGPWRDNMVSILQSELDCRPCSQKKCIYDTIKCMQMITRDKVYEKISGYIS